MFRFQTVIWIEPELGLCSCIKFDVMLCLCFRIYTKSEDVEEEDIGI